MALSHLYLKLNPINILFLKHIIIQVRCTGIKKNQSWEIKPWNKLIFFCWTKVEVMLLHWETSSSLVFTQWQKNNKKTEDKNYFFAVNIDPICQYHLRLDLNNRLSVFLRWTFPLTRQRALQLGSSCRKTLGVKRILSVSYCFVRRRQQRLKPLIAHSRSVSNLILNEIILK